MPSFQPHQKHSCLDSPSLKQLYLNDFGAKPSLPLNYAEAELKGKKGSNSGAMLCGSASDRMHCGMRNGE